MFRKGTRILGTASVLLLLEALAHTLGTISPLPDDPAVQALVRSMTELRQPLGLGMEPSAWDIQRGLAYALTVLFALMGAIGLIIPALAPGDRRIQRGTAGILLVANVALLGLWWLYRIPPPLMFQLAVLPLLAWATFARPAGAGGPRRVP